jgi:putative N6-adenine-specific DNA methylase
MTETRRRECFVVTHPGVERLTASELAGLGIVPGGLEPGGVAFTGSDDALYAANLHLRTGSRVLVRVGSFRARTFPELERHALRLPWRDFLPRRSAIRFSVTSRKSKLYHQGGIAERLARAADAAAGEVRSEADESAQLFVVRALRDEFTISADSSGELLHRRGYRQDSAKAPLRETLAAAMLLAAGWDGGRPLLDPFTGSGTIPIEAALIARRIAPGLGRGFGFERWPGFDATAWSRVRERAADPAIGRPGVPIVGADRDEGAVAAAAANAERAGVAGDIEFRRAALSRAAAPGQGGLLITNPPYGVRVGERQRLRDLYAQLGNVARRAFGGWDVAFLSAHPALEAATELPLEPLFATSNGGIPVRLVRARIPAQGFGAAS